MKEKGRSGIHFFNILTLIFVTLKLTGYIDWAWLWVLGPLWMPTIFAIVILIVIEKYENK